MSRAQDEHDAFAEALRDRGVEVLYLTDLLTETLEQEQARDHAITTALGGLHLGDTMRGLPRRLAPGRAPEELAGYLTAGIRNDEVRGGFGLVTSLLASDDFLIDPLPNLLFTRDSSVWIRDRVAITSLAMPARDARDPADRADLHRAPALRRARRKIHGWHHEHVEGGDVLLLAPRRDRGRRRRTYHARRRRAAGPPGLRTPTWRTRCWPYRSPRSGPPCTSTRSARWSTSTRS